MTSEFCRLLGAVAAGMGFGVAAYAVWLHDLHVIEVGVAVGVVTFALVLGELRQAELSATDAEDRATKAGE